MRYLEKSISNKSQAEQQQLFKLIERDALVEKEATFKTKTSCLTRNSWKTSNFNQQIIIYGLTLLFWENAPHF